MPLETYTVTEVAKLLKLSRVTVWRRVKAGQLHLIYVGERQPRVTYAELQRVLTQGMAA